MAGNPAELIVAAFDREDRAAEVLDVLREIEPMRFIGTWNAAVLTEDRDGKLKLREMAEVKGIRRGARIGAIAGGIPGLLAGAP